MDVSKWSLNQIMQLPDWCFGQRFVINFGMRIDGEATFYRISEIALPDICVLWELDLQTWGPPVTTEVESRYLGLLLGDHLPTTNLECAEMEPMFPGCDVVDNRIRCFQQGSVCRRIRTAYAAQGRRVVLYFRDPVNYLMNVSVSLVFSSIPKEVPDCLLSV